MSLVWHSIGQHYHGSLTENTPLYPAGTWATGELSRKRDDIADFFTGARGSSRQAVWALSRVDTGRMRSETESYATAGRETMSLEFGWWEGNPRYAPYQEFGTRNGIEPMLAVHAVFVAHEEMLKQVISS